MNEDSYRKKVKRDLEATLSRLIGVECKDFEVIKGRLGSIRLGLGSAIAQQYHAPDLHDYSLEIFYLWFIENPDSQTGVYHIGSTNQLPSIEQGLTPLNGKTIKSADFTDSGFSLRVQFDETQYLA
jgi:hypothetical protein